MLLSELHTKMTGDSSGLVDAYGRALVSDKRLADQKRKSEAQEKKTKIAYEKTSAALDKMRRSLDPLYASQKKNAQLQKIVDAQLEAGNITKEQAIRYNQRLAQSLDLSGGSADTYNQKIRTSRFATGNLAAQFNDIGVMMASGQSPLILAVQQGTQVSQVLNMMGSKKEMIAGLGAAFKNFISPVSVLTVALIAGGAALFQWGMKAFGASEEMTKLEEAMTRAREKSESLAESIRQLQLGVTAEELALMDNYNLKVQKLAEAEEKLANNRGRNEAVYVRAVENAERALVVAERELELLRERQSEEERLKNLASEQADLLQEELDLIEAQADAQRAVQRAMIAAKLTASGLVDESGNYLQKMTEVFQRTQNLREELGDAAFEALRLSDVDLESGVDAAAKAAAVLAANLGVSLNRAMSILRLRDEIGKSKEVVFDPRDPNYDPVAADAARMEHDNVSPFDDRRLRDPSVSAGGGGGGGKSEADQLRSETESRLEALQDRFASETELQLEKYQSDQELLKSALEQKLLTEQEYHELTEEAKRKHEEKMAQLDVWRHGSSLAKTEKFLGSMADALAKGNEEMLQISKAFGAAEALVNAWRTYSQVMADDSLPWYAKVPAALSLFSQAMGAVNAIKSVGKGGSGQSAAGGGSSTGGGEGAAGTRQPTQTVNIDLQGDVFSRESVKGLLEQIQSELDRGGRLVLQ